MHLRCQVTNHIFYTLVIVHPIAGDGPPAHAHESSEEVEESSEEEDSDEDDEGSAEVVVPADVCADVSGIFKNPASGATLVLKQVSTPSTCLIHPAAILKVSPFVIDIYCYDQKE